MHLSLGTFLIRRHDLIAYTIASKLVGQTWIALEIARSEASDPAAALLLTHAAHQARDASVRERSSAETGLTGALGILLADVDHVTGDNERALISELRELTEKIISEWYLNCEIYNNIDDNIFDIDIYETN